MDKAKEKIAIGDDSNGSKVAARIVLYDAAEWSASGRKRIAAWLRREAAFLERHHKDLARRYVARWLYD